MRKETKILVALFVIAFVIRGIFVFSTPLRIWDETIYANLGHDLSNNPFDYSLKDSGWSDFIPSSEANYSWPKIGFRAPLLPYLLSFLYLFNLDFLVEFFIVFVGAISICLVYLLGKKIFNEKVALYSSILFIVVPLHVMYSAKILTDVLFAFFVLLSFLIFWKAYVEGSKVFKILFGISLALALLSRYTALWIMPIFLMFFLIRDKSFKFLKDKYLWYSILAFLLILSPWLVYGFYEYGNLFGAFIHGAKAAAYWGGVQSWHFYFDYWWQMFSIIGIVFVASLFYIFYKKEFVKKEVYLLLIWFIFFLSMAIYMPHKEDRFILAIVPAVVLLSGYGISKIKYSKLLLAIVVIVSLFSLSWYFYSNYSSSYTDSNKCFFEANKFLAQQEEAVVITDESPIIYYYSKHETRFYPGRTIQSLESVARIYSGKRVFVFFTSFDMPLSDEKNVQFKEELDSNFEKLFECSKQDGYSAIYKIQ